MSTVKLLQEGLNTLRRAGCEIREEWLDGAGGGYCRLKGHQIYFVDLALSPDDQLLVLLATLRDERAVDVTTLSPTLREAMAREL